VSRVSFLATTPVCTDPPVEWTGPGVPGTIQCVVEAETYNIGDACEFVCPPGELKNFASCRLSIKEFLKLRKMASSWPQKPRTSSTIRTHHKFRKLGSFPPPCPQNLCTEQARPL